ncbi:MAG: DUF2510 domain-containing protein [Acidimicrobiales bacterium]|nr:DUF2510 domain-containing protein [Acidimicrobiales bacterium]MDG1846691.1 DUF2510 domain-containing protein [Acidimicrobiales bacterium]
MDNNTKNTLPASSEGSWEIDPFHRHDQRWWNGNNWSDKVRTGNEICIDPAGVMPSGVQSLEFERPVEPIPTGMTPIHHQSRYLPHLLLFGVFLLTTTVILAIASLFS